MMKALRWNPAKNETLKAERGLSFEQIVVAIESGGLLDIVAHPHPERYPRHRILVVACGNYVHLVPFVEDEDYFFLKTVIPCRKATRAFMKRGVGDAEQ